MTERTLVLTPPRNSGYRDLCLDDSRKRGEAPVALRIDSPHALRLAERWIDDRLCGRPDAWEKVREDIGESRKRKAS